MSPDFQLLFVEILNLSIANVATNQRGKWSGLVRQEFKLANDIPRFRFRIASSISCVG